MAITLHGAEPSQGLSDSAWGLPLPPPPTPLSTGQANAVPTPVLAKAVCVHCREETGLLGTVPPPPAFPGPRLFYPHTPPPDTHIQALMEVTAGGCG